MQVAGKICYHLRHVGYCEPSWIQRINMRSCMVMQWCSHEIIAESKPAPFKQKVVALNQSEQIWQSQGIHEHSLFIRNYRWSFSWNLEKTVTSTYSDLQNYFAALQLVYCNVSALSSVQRITCKDLKVALNPVQNRWCRKFSSVFSFTDTWRGCQPQILVKQHLYTLVSLAEKNYMKDFFSVGLIRLLCKTRNSAAPDSLCPRCHHSCADDLGCLSCPGLAQAGGISNVIILNTIRPVYLHNIYIHKI